MDFFAYAGGGWRAANPIPAGAPKWTRRLVAHDANRHQLLALLDEVARKTDWPTGSTEQLIGDFYASCTDEAGADAAGIAPLAPLLADIDHVKTPADLQRAIRELHAVAVAVPFGVVGAMAYHEPAKFIANVVAASGVPDRARVTAALELAGVTARDAARDADAVLALETKLAAAALPGDKAADPTATDHVMTFAQLEQLSPHVAWRAYFDDAHVPQADLNIAEPKYVQRVDQELVATPIAAWRAYLKWHLLGSAAPWLGKPGAAESTSARAASCVESTEALLSEPLAKKYAERYFPPEARAKARAIAESMMAVLKANVAANTWLAPDTRAKALAKLNATELDIGYPDHWKDTSALAIHRDALWANVAAARRYGVDDNRRMIGKPTPRDLWQLPPTSPGAYIEPMLDQVVLPAGFLQPPAFDPAATDAVLYGWFGVSLAHDFTHAIDLSGSETDIVGRPQSWWTDADRAAFAKRTQCVADQFDGFALDDGTHLQGKRVLSEAVGDTAGLRIAYAALEQSLAAHPVPALDGLTPEQQFFIAWADARGDNIRLETARTMVTSDIHPVPKFRVNAPLSDSAEFQRAFACPAGAAMVRPPAQRCSVW